MMTNLFSIFDPSATFLGLHLNWNWLALLGGGIALPFTFWASDSRHSRISKTLMNFMTKESLNTLGPKNKATVMFMLSLFTFILLNNSLGLLPFVFTASAHLSFTLPLALTMWLGYFMSSAVTNTTHVLSHMLPLETPGPLMPFMVLIETLSSLIRPFTLAIRLSANMVAGHLLLALMSSSLSIMTPFTNVPIILLQILLMLLETAVSLIQAYVFTTLCTLYIQEAYGSPARPDLINAHK